MIVRLSIFLFLLLGSTSEALWGFGRDSREKRQQYTDSLRAWLVHIDKALQEAHLVPPSQSRLAAIRSKFEELSPKLSPQKKADLQQLIDRLPNQKPPLSEKALLELRHAVMAAYRVVTIPAQIPDPQLGRLVYKQHCVACHGEEGDGRGKLALNKRFPMVPPPGNFNDVAGASTRTAFSIYNLLLVGSEGTSMGSFDASLKDHERWSVAFFLMGQPFGESQKALKGDAKSLWAALSPGEKQGLLNAAGTLDTLATLSEREMEERLISAFPTLSTGRRAQLLSLLRRTLPYFSETPRSVQ